MNDDQYQRARFAAVMGLDRKVRAENGRTSLWRVTAAEFTGGRVAKGELATDVAVIGAGVAGLSSALHLWEQGVETLVLEAEQPGSAATGASGGIIAPEFVRDGIARACKLYGKQRGERLARMVGHSAAFTFDLISRHQISCDEQQCGFLSPGRSDLEIDSLRTDSRAWQSLGFPVQFLDARETADAIGTKNYDGALYFESGGVLNPLAYVTGLANILHAADVPVFTNSPARHIREDGRGWVIRTPEASICAKRIVLAANGGNAALHRSLRRTTMPLLVHEYATSPISVPDRRELFGAGVPYTDRQAYVFTVRFDKDGRVISALPEVIPKWGSQRFLREARRRFHRAYEMQPSIDFTWSGTAHLNPSLMPAIYLPEDDLSMVAIQACNGRGLGVNTIIGKEVAELLTSGSHEATSVPLLRPNPVPLHAVASVMPKLIMSVAHTRDRWRG